MPKKLMTVTLNETWLKSARYMFWVDGDIPKSKVLDTLSDHLNGHDPLDLARVVTRWRESEGELERVQNTDFDEDTLRELEV